MNAHSTLRMDDLPYPERLLIWSLRMSYAPQVSDATTSSALEHAFRFAHIALALPSFHAYANRIATGLLDSQMLVDVHCPPCPSVGRDEWHIVQAVAALQAHDRLLADSYLASLLPAAGVRPCCDAGAELARILGHLNFRLHAAAPHPEKFSHPCHHDTIPEPINSKPVLH